MAASLISNALQGNFDSVLSFPDEGMVAMFKALESTGLRGFLGCPSVLYEQDFGKFLYLCYYARGFSNKLCSKQDKKAVLAHDLLEFRVETQENFHTLSAQLSEIIAYINRGRDDKKGEDSSSRVPQPPEDRSRPGDGGRGRGRSSEPSKKRGGGLHRGGGTSSRGFSHWFG
ncbi:hypothetical protein F511_40775 [Dorcoceras hygrometricum]|uniref:Uncharacterized protein n=1 Tax=Dorcoceras hygrometricum TaxID=472368 RepID=A0A2Z7BNY3_9LAMI|nr:hypothetical protein F511_40775 [Dorcoceras hygrometricum]